MAAAMAVAVWILKVKMDKVLLSNSTITTSTLKHKDINYYDSTTTPDLFSFYVL